MSLNTIEIIAIVIGVFIFILLIYSTVVNRIYRISKVTPPPGTFSNENETIIESLSSLDI